LPARGASAGNHAVPGAIQQAEETELNQLCEGRVAIITGAGRGIGREYALELARRGARVVVNDLGGSSDGVGADGSAAQSVVDEIAAAGGIAVASTHDVSDSDAARELIALAVDTYGGLDVLVNNAGILRDRTLASMSDQEWDDVIRVHLRGTFAPSRSAAAYWRDKAKSSGEQLNARLINTTSASGIYGNFGQSNYGAAKGGIASFTLIAAIELGRYGVTVNAIAPEARTRLTDPVMPENVDADPAHIAPVVAWLASVRSAGITGRVFDVGRGRVAVSESWRRGPEVVKSEGVWDAEELGDIVPDLVAKAAPNVNQMGLVPSEVG
jgi:NAD(P)-dependent dehydrogenase (short-subunit alcohol dehydrogenase family)